MVSPDGYIIPKSDLGWPGNKRKKEKKERRPVSVNRTWNQGYPRSSLPETNGVEGREKGAMRGTQW